MLDDEERKLQEIIDKLPKTKYPGNLESAGRPRDKSRFLGGLWVPTVVANGKILSAIGGLVTAVTETGGRVDFDPNTGRLEMFAKPTAAEVEKAQQAEIDSYLRRMREYAKAKARLDCIKELARNYAKLENMPWPVEHEEND